MEGNAANFSVLNVQEGRIPDEGSILKILTFFFLFSEATYGYTEEREISVYNEPGQPRLVEKILNILAPCEP